MCGNTGFSVDKDNLWGITGVDYTIRDEIPNFTPNTNAAVFHAVMCRECKYTLFFQYDPK